MSPGPQPTESKDISTVIGVLRRRGWIVLLCVFAAAGAAYAYSRSQPRVYESSTNLLLRDPAGNATNSVFGTPTPKTAPDREALVLSEPVKARVITVLAPQVGGTAAARAALSKARAQSGEGSSAVKITARASSGRTAALVANTVAEQNVAYRRASSLAKIRRAQQLARRELDRLTADESAPPPGVILQTRLNMQSLRQLAGAQDGDADILQRASAGSSPASPKPTRAAMIGGFAGLLLGFALALVREQLDRRLRGAKDLGETFDLPILASVPTSRALATRQPAGGVDSLPPAEREAFQMLRANLRFLNTDTELRSVVVTSAASGDGKTTVALNLAMADASVGRKVLLIESDMRRPSIGKLLGLGGPGGLATYLARPDVPIDDVIHRVAVTQATNGSTGLSMDVIISGDVPRNPSELMNSERMRSLIGAAEERYDLVVIDTSPVGIVADAIPLMSEASAVIIVSRVGRITSVEADALRDQLQRIDAPAFGLVANFAGTRDKGYGYY